MTRFEWEKNLLRAPRRLTLRQLAKHLKKPYSTTQAWAKKFGYAFKPNYRNGKKH